MPAELPLVPSAVALAISSLLFLFPGRRRAPQRLGIAFVVLGVALPIVLDPLIDPARATGRALWEWSAIGGPTIEAAYKVDALAAVALSLTVAFAGAALATAGRMERRHPALAALILAIGLVTIALVVTVDLVAAIVVLAVLAALSVLGLLAVAPPAATARAAAYLAVGVQAWVLAALLVSRHGSPTFHLGAMPQAAVTSGALLAATIGALLCAGLYPVVAWSFEGDDARDPGPLGSLLLMPVGIAATLLLVRLLGASGLDAPAIALPELAGEIRLAVVVLVLLAVAVTVALSGQVPLRPIAVGLVVSALVAALPVLGWADVVLLASVLTAVYAAVVSLAMPDQWEAVRCDLGIVAVWVGLATGSPLGVAGGMVALFARAAAALAGTLWLVPHRDYVALVGGSAVFVAGSIAVGAGAVASGDPAVAALGLVAAGLLVAIEVVQVGRRFRIAAVPPDLDLASGLVAFLLALLVAILVVPLEAAAREHVRGPQALSAVHIAGIALAATLAVVLARTVRPLLPYFEMAAERSRPAMRALDPVPIGVGAFRTLELTATRASAAFALFEQRAGVWLATLLIVALLVWAVR